MSTFISDSEPSAAGASPEKYMTFGLTTTFARLRYWTYSEMPSLKLNCSRLLTRSMVIPGLRKASSRRRLESISYLNSRVRVNISGSGMKVIFVPVDFVLPMTVIGMVVLPRENSIL